MPRWRVVQPRREQQLCKETMSERMLSPCAFTDGVGRVGSVVVAAVTIVGQGGGCVVLACGCPSLVGGGVISGLCGAYSMEMDRHISLP